ncbi:MAG: carboxypeptidase regulatory-like domain-containing protein, partial [Gemmatimonadaceae bacterium]
MVRRRVAAAVGAALALALAALPAAAQRVVGTVRDSASREPIAGAAVLLLDANGVIVARTISSALGQFSAPRPRARRARVVRIGFRPREITLPST